MLTLQTIEEFMNVLSYGEDPTLEDVERLQTLMETHTLDLLSAAKWAIENGYSDSPKEEESCPSPKNPCFCSCHPEKECLDCLCGRHKPNSSSQQTGRKG